MSDNDWTAEQQAAYEAGMRDAGYMTGRLNETKAALAAAQAEVERLRKGLRPDALHGWSISVTGVARLVGLPDDADWDLVRSVIASLRAVRDAAADLIAETHASPDPYAAPSVGTIDALERALAACPKGTP